MGATVCVLHMRHLTKVTRCCRKLWSQGDKSPAPNDNQEGQTQLCPSSPLNWAQNPLPGIPMTAPHQAPKESLQLPGERSGLAEGGGARSQPGRHQPFLKATTAGQSRTQEPRQWREVSGALWGNVGGVGPQQHVARPRGALGCRSALPPAGILGRGYD